MPGRFPLYTDADIHGPLVDGLRRNGWDVVRAIDELPEGTLDLPHFERAVVLRRVLVSNDLDQIMEALHWLAEGRRFPGLITWPKSIEGRRMRVGRFLEAFEELASTDDPFAHPIVYLKPDPR